MDITSFIKKRGIGLTGGVATGKSTVSRLLRECGYQVFDADELARQAVAPGSATLEAVIALGGEALRGADGGLERKKLGALIFADPSLRLKVESLIHQRIWQLLAEAIEPLRQQGQASPFWFFDAALLFETGNYQRFAEIWLTTCPPSVQRQRMLARDHVTPAYVDQVLASQLPLEKKKDLATVVIDTARPLAEVKKTVRQLLNGRR